MGKKELAVGYRIYPGISKSPAAFPGNKLLFSELCLRSFRRALGDLDVKVYALLDDCPPEYEALFRRYFRDDELEVLHFRPRLGNFGSCRKQIEILLDQDDAEAIYLAEDDYLYRPGTMRMILEFLRSEPDAHFVTAYDHPDYYRLELHRHREEIRVFGDAHWRTAGTTCFTFLTTKTTLRATRRTFERLFVGANDASIWLSLTKRHLFNPWTILRFLRTDRLHFSIVAGAWWYAWRENLLAPRRRLWVPLPGVATQMESTVIAEGYDWRAEIARAEKELLLESGPDRAAGKDVSGCSR